MTTECLLCNGTGKIKFSTRQDDDGVYTCITAVEDEWLAELEKFCKQKKAEVPGEYVIRLIDEIRQLTAIALQTAREKIASVD